jgi:hypothetical protein
MDYLPLPQVHESIPGLRNRVIEHCRKVLSKKLTTRMPPDVTYADLDSLSIEDLYNLSPCVDLLTNPPADRGMDSMLTYMERVDRCLDEKGRNEWASNILKFIHEQKHPRKKWVLRGTNDKQGS